MRFCLDGYHLERRRESENATDADNEDDHLIEASTSDVDEDYLREARNTVMDKIGLKHPIMFDMFTRWQEKQGCLASKSIC